MCVCARFVPVLPIPTVSRVKVCCRLKLKLSNLMRLIENDQVTAVLLYQLTVNFIELIRVVSSWLGSEPYVPYV